jgi:hypothetical protein
MVATQTETMYITRTNATIQVQSQVSVDMWNSLSCCHIVNDLRGMVVPIQSNQFPPQMTRNTSACSGLAITYR